MKPSPTKRQALLIKLRWTTVIYSVAAVVLSAVYFVLRQRFKDGFWGFDFYLTNKAFSIASLVLIAASMLLTGLRYFKKVTPATFALRKHLGLAGFFLGVAHGVASHVLMPEQFPWPGWVLENVWSSALAFVALLIFALMAVASSAKVKGWMGGERWRLFLRYGGYAALIMVAAHAGILKWESWIKYLKTFSSVLPSLSLPAVVFCVVVVGLRLAMSLGKRRRNLRKDEGGSYGRSSKMQR